MRILLDSAAEGAAQALAQAFPEALAERPARGATLLASLARNAFDLCFVEVGSLAKAAGEGAAGLKKLFRELRAKAPGTDLIVLCERDEIRSAVDAVRAGAANYLTHPLDPVEARYVAASLAEARRLEEALDSYKAIVDTALPGLHGAAPAVGMELQTASPAMAEVLRKAKLVAPTSSTVLLTGETGVGKGVLARTIHALSAQKDGPFVAVNCGGLPEQLLESELFGHERGAFTGAVKRKLGRFELAAGGTVFLDEVGTIGEAAQVKLLQVLQEKTFCRVGGETEIEVRARIIAATNENLAELVAAGRFRKDLSYRLNVFPIEIPPLRERREDIPALAETLLARLNRVQQKTVAAIHPDVLAAFTAYDWPGNVRELENVLERAHILEPSGVLGPEVVPGEIVGLASSSCPEARLVVDAFEGETLARYRERAARAAERAYLVSLLVRCSGSIKATALAAGITPRQLHTLMQRHDLHKESFRKIKRER